MPSIAAPPEVQKKTVFILGAGFSKEAGAPSQEELVKKIFENENYFDSDSIQKFRSFLQQTLLVPENLHASVPLEDIFTPLDRCSLDGISFRNLDADEVKDMRNLIYYLIGKTIQLILSRQGDYTYIEEFADYVTRKASVRVNGGYKHFDPVSIISTNWDIILDNRIKSAISEINRTGVVDYCCHISSYRADDESVKPGLEVLGGGGFNVKLLKLHGSLNWLQCPRCLRVYVDFDNKIAIQQYMHPEYCRHCNKNFGQLDSHKLISNLIMPTFLKNLANPQYKIIWQNAGIELAEAHKIVFIGYSLPQADFEMRQLLSRMVRENVQIEVVDFGEEESERIQETMKRYMVFFGSRIGKSSFYLKGAKDYVLNNLLNEFNF